MAVAPTPDIQYYLKETTNQILVSGSSPINAQLNAVKNPTPIFNSNLTSKISSLGANISYVVQNGVEFTNLILNQNLTFPTSTTNASTTATITKNGSINGVGADLFIKSLGSTINQIKVTNIGSGFQVGETITLTQSELLSAGFTLTPSDIVITLTVNNIENSSTIIPLTSDNELWVYKGYSNIGGDGNTYRYNPHLHRPYKAYIVTETGSGIPSSPFTPTGNPIFSTTTGNEVNIINRYLEGSLTSLGNGVLNGVTQINEQVSGSFQIFHEELFPQAWVFTDYTTNPEPAAFGAGFRLFQENTTTSDTVIEFLTLTNPPTNGLDISYNASAPSATKVYVGNETFIYYTLLTLSESIDTFGKNPGKIQITQNSDPDNFSKWDITAIDANTSGNYLTVDVTNYTQGSAYSSLPNNEPITATVSEYSKIIFDNFNQSQYSIPNFQPRSWVNNNLRNGLYTYTSSLFSEVGSGQQEAIGTTQFGLSCEIGHYCRYTATYENANVGFDPVSIQFSGSDVDATPLTFDLPSGFQTLFTAQAGTISVTNFDFGENAPDALRSDSSYASSRLNITLDSVSSRENWTPPSLFSTRWSDAYISYSSSISSSLDGLYVFGQLPQNNVQVTASMFLQAWTGSDDDAGAKYGTAIYDTDVYGEGESGDGPTWPTASIRFYTGSFPNSIPTSLDAFVTESLYENANIHVNGLAITMSYLIPSESIGINDCFSLSLQVSSGSANSASVENSLVVNYYELEFNTPGTGEEDSLVPTFIENAFSGSQGFSNVSDCQPLYNNVFTERINPYIQLVNYTTDIYTPLNQVQIRSGSAAKSTVPVSNYTQLASINPRYDGSRSNSQQLNIWNIGDTGTFGKKPNIDLKDAFFGYFSDIDDPYPNINGLTRVNLSYLIDEQGNALPPTLEDQLSIDTYNSVFPPTTQARLAARNGKDQFKQLGKPSNIKSIMNYVTPILYTQNSGDNYVVTMSLSGSGYISRYDNGDGEAQIFGRFVAEGQAIPEPTGNQLNDQYVEYFINPTESVVIPEGSMAIGAGSPWNTSPSDPSATYLDTYWGNIGAGQDLANEQIITLKHSFVTSFVSERRGPQDELQFSLKMFDDAEDQPFNLEDITCRVYTIDGSSTDIGSVLGFGWFSMSNIVGYRNEILNTNAGPINLPRWLFSRVPIIGDGINCTVDWEMYETLYDYGLMRERGPKGNGGVIGLEWTITANSGKYTIKSGSKIKWQLKGSFKDADGGYQQGFFFPTTYNPTPSNPYTSATIKGQGAYDHLLDEANTAQAPFWVIPTEFIDNNWDTYKEQNSGVGKYSTKQVLIMQSPNLNEAYGTDFKQGDTPYIPGASPYFPGGMEPEGTAFDRIENTILLEEGDEIRFANNENFTYTIIEVSAPNLNLKTNGSPGVTKGRLRIVLDREVNQGLNFDFFFIRRPITVANTLYLERQFPYAALASASLSESIVSFTGSENKPNVANEGNIGLVYSGTGVDMEGSYTASFSSLESATTPGILFPDFPTDYLIESASIIVNDLITRRIIES
tara:strand:+ start:1479 stop:6065 length:4587 start_codon:yes stop_codon:yes gene_type:complete